MANSKDLRDFNEQDFINHPYFQEWIIAPDDEKNRFWQSFLATYPEKKQAIDGAAHLLKAIAFKESWPADEMIERSLNKALETIRATPGTTPLRNIPARVTPLYRRWSAAAAVLILLAAGWWFLANGKKENRGNLAGRPATEDIAPGGNKAILTLADGTKVILDTAGNGAIIKQGGVTVIKLNGQLAYDPSNSELPDASTVTYNTITTPKGGLYGLLLADGSKVWLNAASSLRFPTVFTGNERRVELTGEGYFEVAHNAEKPFHVTVNNLDVQVLGTHFNINSYSDEPAVKTTLLEGRVMIRESDKLVYLNPGQQAIAQPGQANFRIVNDTDVEEVVAWKNGLFIFNNTPLENIMRQIARWYNVDIVYQGSVPQDTFNGNISRNTNLSEVLKVLEFSNIRFKVEGNTITVLPQ